MKKRIIAFLVVALQIFSLQAFAKTDFPVPEWMLDDVVSTSAGMGEEYTDSYSLLSFLGAVDEPAGRIDPDSFASRGYAVEIFAKLYLGADLNKPTRELYLDVPFEHENASGIYAAVECGLTEETESRFYPDKAVTVNEVAKMGLVLLGYSGIDNINVSKQMNTLKFLKGVSLNGDALTKGQLFTMIRNILRADVLDYSVSKKNGVVEYQGVRSGKSFLSEQKNIYLIEGIVTSFGESAVYGKQADFDERIEINKIKYNSYGKIDEDVLGKNIYAYVYDPDDEALVIDIWDKGENETYEISETAFSELSNSYLSYKEDGKTKKLKLNSESQVVYNGQYYGTVEKAVRNNLASGISTVKAIDNTGDNAFDIVFLEKIDYFVVDKVAPLAEQITFKYSDFVLKLKDEENVVIKNTAGDNIEIGSVSTGYVLELKEATRVNGEKCYDIKVSNNKVTAELEESYQKNGVTYYKIGEEAYTFSAYYENYLASYAKNEKPEVGQSVTLYIGSNNKIVLSDTNPYTFGYLLYTRQDTGIDASVWVKLYSESGKFEELKLKETVNVITFDNQSGSQKSDVEAIATFCDSEGNLENQLICYIKNSKDEITTMVKEYDLTGTKPYDTGYPLVKNRKVGGEGSKTNGNHMYFRVFGEYEVKNGLWFLPTDLKNMTVAKDSKNFDDESYFGMGKFSGALYEKYFMDETCLLYNADEFGNVGFMLMLGGSSASTNSRAFMVCDVSMAVGADGEPGKTVEYYDANNRKQSIFVGNSETLESSAIFPGVESTDNGNNLQIGDIFKFRADNNGEAEYIQIVSKAGKTTNTNWTYTDWTDNHYGYGLGNMFTFASNALWSAQVIETSPEHGGRLKVNIDPAGKYSSDYDYTLQMNQYAVHYGNTIINLYDSSEGTVEVASFGDILPGDRVFLVYHWTSVINVFIIR